MTSRERIITALDHREPDHVPYDLGGTVITGITVKAYTALRDYLGLRHTQPEIIDVLQQLAKVEDDVMDRLKVDVRNISPRSTATFQIEIKESEDKEYTYFYDEYHIGWRMPKKGGLYYDMFDHPLKGSLTLADVDEYQLPDPVDPARFIGLKESAKRVLEEEQRALIMGNISAGIFELYLWTRGFSEGYADFVGDVALSQKMLNKYMDLQIAYWEKVFEVLGPDSIDVVQMADDFAGQFNMLISPSSYRKYLKPLHKEMFDFIHSRCRAKIFFHSCGAIRPVLWDLIEVGVDIINPVQVSAAGMDSASLKKEFGRDVTFWGGGVDTQNAFDERFTPEQVREDVRRRVEDFMPGGGFVFNTVHNIQGNVPPQNIMAMWEALQEYGRY